MRAPVVLLLLMPGWIQAAEGGTSRYDDGQEATPAPAAPASAPRPTEEPPPPVEPPPLGVDASPQSWRLEVGYGVTREHLHYKATASPNSPTLPGYATTSSDATATAKAPSLRLDLSYLVGVQPGARRAGGGFLWGVDLELAQYAQETVTLPATDADTTVTSANGSSFACQSLVQTFAVGMPVGWTWGITPQLAFEAVAFAHVGILHGTYTSGENIVNGPDAPLGPFKNDLYNFYADAGVRARLDYRFVSGVELMASAGYLAGKSLTGKLSDAVTYSQGSANAQTGTYEERLSYRVDGGILSAGLGYDF